MLLRVLCLCCSLMVLLGCGEQEKQNGPKPLIVIISPDNPPFEFKDTAQGGDKVIGFDVDVIHKVGEHLGRPIKIVEADFSGLIPALQAGRADMAISGFNPTDERWKSVDFSEPYHIDKEALLLLEDSGITSEKDLQGKKLGVQLGSAHETIARKWDLTMPGLSIISLNKGGELVQELKSGRLQAVLTEASVARKVALSTPGLKVVTLDIPGDASAIAFPKGSPLVGPTNEALKAIKGDIKQLEDKWFTQ